MNAFQQQMVPRGGMPHPCLVNDLGSQTGLGRPVAAQWVSGRLANLFAARLPLPLRSRRAG